MHRRAVEGLDDVLPRRTGWGSRPRPRTAARRSARRTHAGSNRSGRSSSRPQWGLVGAQPVRSRCAAHRRRLYRHGMRKGNRSARLADGRAPATSVKYESRHPAAAARVSGSSFSALTMSSQTACPLNAITLGRDLGEHMMAGPSWPKRQASPSSRRSNPMAPCARAI